MAAMAADEKTAMAADEHRHRATLAVMAAMLPMRRRSWLQMNTVIAQPNRIRILACRVVE